MKKLRVGDEVWVRAEIIGIHPLTGSFEIRLAGLGFPDMTQVWAEADHFGKNVIAEDEDRDIEEAL